MRLRNLILLVIATVLPLAVLVVLASYLLLSHEQANFVNAVKDRNRAFVLVALTGYGQPDDKAQAFSAGFDLHVTKPIGVEHLDPLPGEFRARPERAAKISSGPRPENPGA